jgi:chemotaxis protein CheD
MATPPSALARPAPTGAPGEAHTFLFERDFNRHSVKVLPGEFFVAGNDIVLTTVLGSCVAACIWDRSAGIGGMNHFMLPDGGTAGGSSDAGGLSGRYGVFAMEQLINEIIKRGGRKDSFEAKVFGGGHVMKTFTTSVGTRNAEFVLEFLKAEGVRVASQDLLDVHPRRVAFFPNTGRALCKKLAQADATLVAAEQQYRSRITTADTSGDVELF